MRNNNKALYESIMKDVAKIVKRKINEEESFVYESEEMYNAIMTIADGCFGLPTRSGRKHSDYDTFSIAIPANIADEYNRFKIMLRKYLEEYFETH